jgi:hypothetical protein
LPGAAAALSFAENQGCQPWGGTGPTSKGPVVGRVDEVADDAFRKDVPRAGVRLRPSSTDTVRVAVRLSHRQPGHLGCQLRWRRGVELRWLVALWLPREARGMPCRRSCQKEMTGCLRLPPGEAECRGRTRAHKGAECLSVDGTGSSTVEVPAPAPSVRLGPELAFQLHQAPDPGAVGADVGLDVGGRLTDDGQVEAEQLRAPLQRRCDRPAQVRVVPGPHRSRVSNTSSRANRERCVVRWWGRSQPIWAALGPRKTGRPRTTADSGGQPTAEVSNRFRAFPQVGR